HGGNSFRSATLITLGRLAISFSSLPRAMLDKGRNHMLNREQFIINQFSSRRYRTQMQAAKIELYSIGRLGALSASGVGLGYHRLSYDGRNRGDLWHGHRSGHQPSS